MIARKIANITLGLAVGIVTWPLAVITWPVFCAWYFWNEGDEI